MKTNEMIVASVYRDSVAIAINGQTQTITWERLRAAAEQADADLAYVRLLSDATNMAADGPVIVTVRRDNTNVWWVVSVTAEAGGGRANWHRLADEGGTHPNQMLAGCEADDICHRLGKRVVARVGFDGTREKAQAASVRNRG
jgi:hypothetical protein